MILTVKEILEACRQLSPNLRATIYTTLMQEEQAELDALEEAQHEMERH